MKKISFMLAFLAFTTTASFAETAVGKNTSAKNENPAGADKTSCTVAVTSGKYNVRVTISCNCTRRHACDAAYRVSSALL